MQQLEALAREAAALATARAADAAEAEVARQMQICNACRYCEGFCAVFPAMTRRLEFGKADVHYLANLCHNCGACLHACQYAPPHEFAVNVPQAMAQVRGQTYADYAWPPALRRAVPAQRPDGGAGAGRRAGAVPGAGGWRCSGTLWHAPLAGNFYAVFPHNLLVGDVRRRCSASRCWRWRIGVRALLARRARPAARRSAARGRGEAARDALALKYLDGGHGEGCNDDGRRASRWRAGASTTSPSTASCCASRRPASPRCTTTLLGLAGAVRR